MEMTSVHSRKRHFVYRTALVLFLVIMIGFTGTVEAQEPSLLNIFATLGFTNLIEVPGETFPPGTYELTLLAEFSDGHAGNTISIYQTATSGFQVLISGAEGNVGFTIFPIVKNFTRLEAEAPWGLALDTPAGQRFFSEQARNSDGVSHVRIYKDQNNPGTYLIGFEDLPRDQSDQDFQDIILKLIQTNPVTVPITFTRHLQNGKAVTVDAIVEANPHRPDFTMESTITLDGAMLLQIATLYKSHDPQATHAVTFGPPFAGLEKGHFTASLGQLAGAIDGQAIMPVPSGPYVEVVRTLIYFDGTPIRVTDGSDEIREALTMVSTALREGEVETTVRQALVLCNADCGRTACEACGFQFNTITRACVVTQITAGPCLRIQYDRCKAFDALACSIKTSLNQAATDLSQWPIDLLDHLQSMVTRTPPWDPDIFIDPPDPPPPPPEPPPPPDPFKTECVKRINQKIEDCKGGCPNCTPQWVRGEQPKCDTKTGEVSGECDTCAVNEQIARQQCSAIPGTIEPGSCTCLSKVVECTCLVSE